jgi:hypothetical protein
MPELMPGPRSWLFASGGESVGMEETDFRVEYRAERKSSGHVELSIALLGCWEHYDWGGEGGVARRFLEEERFRETVWGFVGRRGTLSVDAGTPRSKDFEGATLLSVVPSAGRGGGLPAWDAIFGWPLSRAGAETARTLSFRGREVEARAFVVQYLSEDRTKFREIFRAAPVRVPSGPPLRIVKVSAIVRDAEGETPLERRAAAEAEIRSWTWELVGEEGELSIDGEPLGAAHLRSCAPSELTLPDAVVYDLEFVSGYAS